MRLLFLPYFLGVVGTWLLSTTVSTRADDCEVSVGVVPQFEQRKLLGIWQPILTAVEATTGCRMIFAGSENISDFEGRFASGQFDIAYMNPYHALVANRAQGYEPVLRSGSRELQGVLVVAASSDINDVQSLDGKILVFPSPNALGASLLMRAELALQQRISIHPKYVKTHPSVYLHVAKGLASAGGGVQRTLDEQPPEVRDRLKVIYRTSRVPAHPLVVHPRLDKGLKEKLVDAFLQLAQEKPELFDNIPMRDPIKTSIDDYRVIGDLKLEDFAQ